MGYLYYDGQGLGAEEVVASKVLRVTLPWAEAQARFAPEGQHLPEFERRMRVTVRAYQWTLMDGQRSDLPFLLFEIWGRPQAIVEAVLEVSARGRHTMAEMLVP